MSIDSEVSQLAKEVDDSGYFEPTSSEDHRKKILREVVARRGQPEFRKQLIKAYGGVCAITGCDAVDALEPRILFLTWGQDRTMSEMGYCFVPTSIRFLTLILSA